jgi:hypothetical protein
MDPGAAGARHACAARFDAATADLRKANILFVRWMVGEETGPQYPFGMTRDSPGGEEFWRKWWDENHARCSAAVDSARAVHPAYTPGEA